MLSFGPLVAMRSRKGPDQIGSARGGKADKADTLSAWCNLEQIFLISYITAICQSGRTGKRGLCHGFKSLSDAKTPKANPAARL
jgi:hypothetical protein